MGRRVDWRPKLVLMAQLELAEIAFTSKELEGDAFQRPLEDVGTTFIIRLPLVATSTSQLSR